MLEKGENKLNKSSLMEAEAKTYFQFGRLMKEKANKTSITTVA